MHRGPFSAVAGQPDGGCVDISAINDMPISRPPGAGTITDLTIRTLLTLPAKFVPNRIISLMRYPDAARTLALCRMRKRIQVDFHPATAGVADTAAVCHGRTLRGQGRRRSLSRCEHEWLSTAEWNQLMARIGAIPAPVIATKPSSAAIPDPQATLT